MKKLYSKNNCQQCETLKNMLNSKGILQEYEVINLDEISTSEKENVLLNISFVYGIVPRSVPFVIDSDKYFGYQDYVEKVRGI